MLSARPLRALRAALEARRFGTRDSSHPDRAAPARMRQGKDFGQVAAEVAHGLRQGRSAAAFQITALGVTADEKRQLALGQVGEEPLMPQGRAFRAGRQIPVRSRARVAKPHGGDCDSPGVVECRFVDPHPSAQTVAAVVLPGNAARMNFRPGRLADDQDSRLAAHLHHRPRPERQVRRADGA